MSESFRELSDKDIEEMAKEAAIESRYVSIRMGQIPLPELSVDELAWQLVEAMKRAVD